ncbi:fidgetin-like protein 1 isoform X1 [Drosophila sulfurigaster albostrigata]|uniref:fidgetin-like protein 1 isoform X1 n=1 Tax=Drosophila sulfurigaster albostrigata TaxID=89887 RepID=UPI002D21D079|nr:fidgetin-like protein 1 isoform X1 [Drosophila sulfurigaster albostrigata]
MSNDQWSKIFGANENIWLDSSSSVSKKQNAWRTQKILLAHATRSNLNEAMHYEILKEHQEKLESSSDGELYMKERLASCEQLLAESRRARHNTQMTVDWSQLPSSSSTFLHCHGKYESCRGDEVTIDELQPATATNSGSGNNSRSANSNSSHNTNVASSNNNFSNSNNNNINHNSNNNSNHNSNMTSHNNNANNGNNNISLNSNSIDNNQLSQSHLNASSTFEGFRTAREQLVLHDAQKNNQNPSDLMNYSKKKSLGGRGRGVNAKFVQPIGQSDNNTSGSTAPTVNPVAAPSVLPSLAHLDPLMVEQITRESMHKYKTIAWEDVAGLEYAKSTFMETIIHPLQRPDLFKGVRRPPRGVLLFGPPGTGKTLIAKCIASQSRATFFSINPSSLTSKWVGEGEKLVKTLFAVAAAHQPAIIFMDEVDSLLSQRSDNEHESSRRLKNEFFIQLDGAATNEDDNIMIIGATNRPQELDEAVRRRFVRRLYVPLPVTQARQQIITNLLKQVQHSLSDEQIEGLAELTEGYSGADMDSLCRYAAMQPLRSLSSSQIDSIDAQQLPAVTMSDFMSALQHVSKSVSPEDIKRYVSWNEIYGIKY